MMSSPRTSTFTSSLSVTSLSRNSVDSEKANFTRSGEKMFKRRTPDAHGSASRPQMASLWSVLGRPRNALSLKPC